MAKTNIEWTNYSWNFVTGCTKVSQGCKHCYAETVANRFWKDRKFTDVQIDEGKIMLPFHYKKPRKIFVNSMSDLFHEKVPFSIIKRAYIVMQENPRHTYQILTKRPERALEFYNSKFFPHVGGASEPDFIWHGVTVEYQKTADERIPTLLETPTAIRWISAEPLLGDIDLHHYLPDWLDFTYSTPRVEETLDWVVVGGESGRGKRPFDCDWARSLRDQCKATNVPFFMKQVDKVKPIPEDLLIREYPKCKNGGIE